MPRVDFYILADGSGTSIDRFACNIAAKAWGKGNRVHIHTPSEDSAKVMDDLLWTFHDISFVPHEIVTEKNNDDTAITIGFDDHFPESAQVMINLDNEIPAFVNSFDRVVEIVGGNENNKQNARQRYRQYKDAACEIHDHKIDKLKEHG